MKDLKILYAFSGSGYGQINRAMEIIPLLKERGKVDLLLSGTQSEIMFPFEIKYKLKGLGLITGKGEGIDYWKTFVKMKSYNLRRVVRMIPIKEYDLIINDFEPVSAWAAIRERVPTVGLSHHVAALHPLAPEPKKSSPLGKLILKHYAPATFNYGFHFKPLDKNIFTPVIRKAVRDQLVSNNGHYTVYLPAYDEERIIKTLKKFKNIEWQVFSKQCTKKYSGRNIAIHPFDNELFLESMASAEGIICNASFATPAEALFLKKKLMVIPAKHQYEQFCNAAMLKSMGVMVMKKLKTKSVDKIKDFLDSTDIVSVDYPDITESILDMIIENHAGKHIVTKFKPSKYSFFR